MGICCSSNAVTDLTAGGEPMAERPDDRSAPEKSSGRQHHREQHPQTPPRQGQRAPGHESPGARPRGHSLQPANAAAAVSENDSQFPYEFLELLGKGHFGKVKRCRHRKTGKEYAVKIIDKRDLAKTAKAVKQELDVLRQLGRHPNVVALEDYWEGKERCYIVMELCRGGDLFTRIVTEGKYSEKRAARICRQLATALQFIHSKGITHRDLKPENILLTDHSLDADVKVADFGLSKLMKSQQHMMMTVCGTWAYCAPEVITRKPYTQAVDNWTMGVLMFILLSGYHPFDVYGETPEPELLKKIQAGKFDFEDEVWAQVSPEAKDLIRRLIVMEPEKRLSLEDYLNTPWVKGEGVRDKPLKIVVERLSKFNEGRKKFRALVLAKLIAGKFRASISQTHSRQRSASLQLWPLGQRTPADGSEQVAFPQAGAGSPPFGSQGAGAEPDGLLLPGQVTSDGDSSKSRGSVTSGTGGEVRRPYPLTVSSGGTPAASPAAAAAARTAAGSLVPPALAYRIAVEGVSVSPISGNANAVASVGQVGPLTPLTGIDENANEEGAEADGEESGRKKEEKGGSGSGPSGGAGADSASPAAAST